jgi:hypothetical protein
VTPLQRHPLDAATEARVLARLLPWLQRRQALIASHTPERLPPHWPRCGLTAAA